MCARIEDDTYQVTTNQISDPLGRLLSELRLQLDFEHRIRK
jgi:hypothetical protein